MGWMDLVDGVGYAVDTPRALAHGLVAKLGDAVRGKPIRSNWRASGREMLESLGVLGPNQEGIDAGDLAGFGAEYALDPLNLLGAGVGLKLLGKYRKPASQVAEVLNQVDEAPILAERVAEQVPEAVRPVVEAAKEVRPPKPKWERPDLNPGEGPFYSRLERAVEALQGNEFKPQSVMNKIKSYPEGVSQEEIDWTGVADFLKGKKTVSKVDLLEHVRANRPKVNIVPGGSNWKEYVQPGKLDSYQEDAFQWGNPTVTDKEWVDSYDPSTGDGSYQLSGGGALVWATRAPKVDGWKLQVMTPGRRVFDTSLETVVKADSPDAVKSAMDQMLSVATDNKSSHYNVPNVLAHGRSTKRDTPLGRVLLGEEQQSDWFQDARTDGYRGEPVSNPEWRDDRGSLVSSYGVVRPGGENGVLATPRHPFQGNGTSSHRFDSVDEAKQYLIDNAMDSDTRMSRAPMSESWPEMVLKKQLYDAASDPEVDYFGLPSGKGVREVTGGELAGQQQFYDKDQVARVNKLLKKFGVGMEDAGELANPQASSSAYLIESDVGKLARLVDRMGGADRVPNDTMDRVMQMLGRRMARRGVDPQVVAESLVDQGVPLFSAKYPEMVANAAKEYLVQASRSPASKVAKITPEMRQEILRKGFPLMSVALASLLGPQLMDEGV